MISRTVLISAAAALLAASVAHAQTDSKPGKPAKPGSAPAAPIKPVPPGKPDAKPSDKPRTVPGQLKEGDTAPVLDVDEWVRGPKVEDFRDDKVYVVEFWATWCGPCVQSIPHLTALQREHKKDVVVIGVAASERATSQGGPDTRLQNLKNFVKGKGKQMDYRVAFDGDRQMWSPWMAAAGEGGIPHAFVVNHEGKIAWHGHPNDLERGMKDALDALKKSKSESRGKKNKDKDDDAEETDEDATDSKPAETPDQPAEAPPERKEKNPKPKK